MHWREVRDFRRRYGALLAATGSPLSASAPRVLFPHGSPGIFRTLVDGMLAKAFQLRGYRPVFVVNRHDLWHEEYLRTFGYRDFVFLEDNWADERACAEEARAMLASSRLPLDVIGLERAGVEVGRHTASLVLKRLNTGTIDLDDPVMRERLEAGLTSSLRTAAAAERIYDAVEPEKIVTSEKGYTPWGEFCDVALLREVDVLHWYRSQLEHRLMFRRYRHHDRYGHFFSLCDETWEQVKRMPWSEADGEALQQDLRTTYLTGAWFQRKAILRDKQVRSPVELREHLRLDPEKRTAFVFSHILDDATYWFGENLFTDYGEWLLETIGAACANPAVNWVIKMHPENVKNERGRDGGYRLEELEEYKLITGRYPSLPEQVRLMIPEDDTNTVSLFDFADYAVTVRGTVGLEFPCFGTPTFTAGTGGYSGRGFTHDSTSAREYLARLASIQDVDRMEATTTGLAQRFSYGVFYLKPMPIESFTWTRESELSRYFSIRARTPEELAEASDLNAFADWAESAALDLLDPAHADLSRGGSPFEDQLSVWEAESARAR
jgi:Capsule polysaccharide biosynthesis protein